MTDTGAIPPNHMNRSSLLSILRRQRATRVQLAERTGLTFMAVTRNLKELLELGLIREDGLEDSPVGRKSVVYTINETFAYTAGIYINMYETQAAVMDLQGSVVSFCRLPMPPSMPSLTRLVEQVSALLREAIGRAGVPAEKLLGVGIGVPGPVDPERGVVLTPPNLPCLQYIPLKGIIEQAVQLPALLQKDANVTALGEMRHGAARGYNDMMYIYADMGIGGGLILNGKLHLGCNAGAGEIGHITLDLNGPICNCASVGCLEALASGLAIVRRYQHEKGGHPTIADILGAAKNNEPCAVMCLNDSARWLGVAVGGLINLLDLPVIVIGGLLPEQYAPYLDIVRQSALEKKMKHCRNNHILPSALGSTAGIIGAGELVADRFFKNDVFGLLDRKSTPEPAEP